MFRDVLEYMEQPGVPFPGWMSGVLASLYITSPSAVTSVQTCHQNVLDDTEAPDYIMHTKAKCYSDDYKIYMQATDGDSSPSSLWTVFVMFLSFVSST